MTRQETDDQLETQLEELALNGATPSDAAILLKQRPSELKHWLRETRGRPDVWASLVGNAMSQL